jgi:hypothetical protein
MRGARKVVWRAAAQQTPRKPSIPLKCIRNADKELYYSPLHWNKLWLAGLRSWCVRRTTFLSSEGSFTLQGRRSWTARAVR